MFRYVKLHSEVSFPSSQHFIRVLYLEMLRRVYRMWPDSFQSKHVPVNLLQT